MIKFDVYYINPLGNTGIMYAFQASSPEQAIKEAPQWLASCSHWKPEQFNILLTKISIYEGQ